VGSSLGQRKNKIRHSVLCLTYNQVEYVEKAILSLFSGEVWPDEVFILDDCSTDGTIEKIKELEKKYFAQIKPIFNPVNLGLYENLNQQIGLPTGDMIHLLAGDDWVKPGMFERMNFEIEKRNLDPRSESFILIPDFYFYRDGRYSRHSNTKGCVDKGLLKATLRQSVAHRLDGMSAAFFRHYPRHTETLGLWADYHHMALFSQYCDDAYLLYDAFPVYRLGVGVSSQETSDELNRSFIAAIQLILEDMKGVLCRSDIRYLKYLITYHQVKSQVTIGRLLKLTWGFWVNSRNGAKFTDLSQGWRRIINYYLGLVKSCIRI